MFLLLPVTLLWSIISLTSPVHTVGCSSSSPVHCRMLLQSCIFHHTTAVASRGSIFTTFFCTSHNFCSFSFQSGHVVRIFVFLRQSCCRMLFSFTSGHVVPDVVLTFRNFMFLQCSLRRWHIFQKPSSDISRYVLPSDGRYLTDMLPVISIHAHCSSHRLSNFPLEFHPFKPQGRHSIIVFQRNAALRLLWRILVVIQIFPYFFSDSTKFKMNYSVIFPVPLMCLRGSRFLTSYTCFHRFFSFISYIPDISSSSCGNIIDSHFIHMYLQLDPSFFLLYFLTLLQLHAHSWFSISCLLVL